MTGGPLASWAQRFAFNDGVMETVVGGLGASDWRHRPEGGGNSAVWIAGHLAATRRSLLRRLGEEVATEEWEARFKRGVPCRDASTYPSAAVLVGDFHAIGKRLAARLREATEEQAREPWGSDLPDGSKDVAGGCGFLHFHETYHLGQFSYLRRIRGHAGIP